jgi:hypothetical protein
MTMPRRFRMLAGCCVATACLAAGATGAAASGPTAHAARSCTTPDYPGSGYFYSITVRNVGCRKGRKVTLAHYRCRTESGRKGRCHHRVLRYRCRERRYAVIPTQYSAKVTCRRGDRRVIYRYQQNT